MTLRATRLLHSKGRKDEHTFDQSGKDDGKNQDRSGSTWVTASGFSSLGTEDANAESCTDGCESNVE